MDKTLRYMLIGPISLLLKSKRFIIAVITLVLGLVTLAAPSLDTVRPETLTLLITIALALIGGYTLEDAAAAARGRDTKLDTADIKLLIAELIESLLDADENRPLTIQAANLKPPAPPQKFRDTTPKQP